LRGTVLNPIGAEFVEEGDTTVDGIIFPAVLHEYNKSGDLVQSIKFDKIMVNQPLSDGLFEMPSLTDLYKSATAAKPKTTATPPPPASAATPPPPLLPSLKPN
jgi:hypothetical protein